MKPANGRTLTPSTVRSSDPPGPRTTGVRRKGGDDAPLVLLVDDTEDARELLADYLALRGLRVAQAANGEVALQMTATLLPDVVVMDLQMPVLDGWAATRSLKAGATTQHIPVVVLTGYRDEEGLRAAVEAGACSVLTKPCRVQVIHDAILDALRRVEAAR